MANKRQSSAPAPAPAPALGAATEPEGAPTGGASVGVLDQARASVPGYPMRATLRNHGPLTVMEPSTWVYVGAGGNAPVELQDEAHVKTVRGNLAQIEKNHGWAAGTLELAGLPT